MFLDAPTSNHLARVQAADRGPIARDLDVRGYAMVASLLSNAEADDIARLYDSDGSFRSRVVMGRHGFGRGEYKYFARPLPPVVEELREAFYQALAPIANRWHETLGVRERFPESYADFLSACREAGQTQPTPLLLDYREGDYNCLHQDLYGPLVFPLQVVILLSEPGRDFTGGEFVLTEQRPRMQSRVEVVPLRKGDAAVFAVNRRPVAGALGPYRVAMRHGVSRILSGRRRTLGVILHDAP